MIEESQQTETGQFNTEVFRPSTISSKSLKKSNDKKDIVFGLFNKQNPEEVIDEYERSIGIKPPKKKELNQRKYYNELLDLTNAEDNVKLNKLLNNSDKYTILKWSENWNREGEYKVYVIYFELCEEISNEQNS